MLYPKFYIEYHHISASELLNCETHLNSAVTSATLVLQLRVPKNSSVPSGYMIRLFAHLHVLDTVV